MLERLRDNLPSRRNWLGILLGIACLAGLYAISYYNFLVFHSLTEAFTIVIAIAVCAIYWNTRQFVGHGAYLVVGLGCVFAGAFDLVYVFGYPGMSVFPGANGNTALQAKTVAQFYVAASCIGGALLLRRKINLNLALLAYCVPMVLAVGAIFVWRVFPDCYVEGVGITPFARVGLLLSCAGYLVTIWLIWAKRDQFDRQVLVLLSAALAAFFVQDAASAAATDMNGFARTAAHLCQIVAIWFVYKALVVIGLTRPYDLMFRSQQRSAEELQIIFDSVPAWIFYKDQGNRFLRVNRSFAEAMGMPREQLEGRSLSDLYPPSQAEAYWRDDQAVIASGQAKTNIIEPVETATQQRWVQTDKIPYRDAEGKIVGIIGMSVDITEGKRAEESLRASEERYRLLVETIPQLAWRASPTGLERDWNRRWYEYTGQTPAQARRHGWLNAVHPDDLPRVNEEVLREADTPEPYEIEYRLRRASDGSYRWHLARAVPVRGEDGQVLCWIGSATDVEDLKQAQEMLKLARDEELQRHRAELAHVGRLSMMGEMAATLAHELNQPLHAVKNYASGGIRRLRKSPEPDAELVAVLGQIGDEASRAAEIIRRVIGFVRKREPRFCEVFVNDLIEEAVLLGRSELEQRRAKIVFELGAALPAVIGDPIQIEQVLVNLVRNGLEAMEETPEEDRLLVIRTLRQDHQTIQVDVCDSGKGMRKEELERIFEPFVTTKPEGMGMGLAISRSIIEAHGGRLWATLGQTHGCTFHFTLPAI